MMIFGTETNLILGKSDLLLLLSNYVVFNFIIVDDLREYKDRQRTLPIDFLVTH